MSEANNSLLTSTSIHKFNKSQNSNYFLIDNYPIKTPQLVFINRGALKTEAFEMEPFSSSQCQLCKKESFLNSLFFMYAGITILVSSLKSY